MFCSGFVAWEGSFQGDEWTRTQAGVSEDLKEVGGLRKLIDFCFLKKLWVVGSEERMWKSSLRTCLSFGRLQWYMVIKELKLCLWVAWGT